MNVKRTLYLISVDERRHIILPLLLANVYVHGTYWSGQWTCSSGRVVLVVGGGVGAAGIVGTAGGEGKRVSSVPVKLVVTEYSICTGFRQSSDITSCFPWTSTMNVLDRSMTL